MRHVRFAFAAVVALFAVAAASAAGADDGTWYWSEYTAAHALYVNGIRWSSGTDTMRQTHCWGLGHWLVDSSGGRHFRHFYCTVWPQNDAQYDVVVNVTGESLYAVNWAGYEHKSTWYWPAQMTANTLVKNGIRWTSASDPVSSDSCSPFGEWLRRSGTYYYKHFYCAVRSSARSPYTVVVSVTDKLVYDVRWVAYDAQLPATPTLPTPVTSTSSASGGASTTTSIASNKAVWNQILGQALLQSQQQQIYSTWHNSSIPNTADWLTGQVACRSDPNAFSYAYSSYTACG
jgi:hypothetical protein